VGGRHRLLNGLAPSRPSSDTRQWWWFSYPRGITPLYVMGMHSPLNTWAPSSTQDWRIKAGGSEHVPIRRWAHARECSAAQQPAGLTDRTRLSTSHTVHACRKRRQGKGNGGGSRHSARTSMVPGENGHVRAGVHYPSQWRFWETLPPPLNPTREAATGVCKQADGQCLRAGKKGGQSSRQVQSVTQPAL